MSDSLYSKRYTQILKRLKEARIEAGLSQQQVADADPPTDTFPPPPLRTPFFIPVSR